MSKEIITLDRIDVTFQQKKRQIQAVKDVSIRINQGDIYGIVGYSGAGKSTLVRVINLLQVPTGGTITVDNDVIFKDKRVQLSAAQLRQKRQDIGMIFQHFNLMSQLTAEENVAFALKHSGLSKEEKKEKVKKLLDLVGLADRAENYPSQLSGGQKQRVAIARALANDPKILISDEATSALDPKRVAVMQDGQLIEEGSVLDIFSNPNQDLTRDFITTATGINEAMVKIEKQEIVQNLAPNSILVQLEYAGTATDEPLLNQIYKKYQVTANILYGNIEILDHTPVGALVVVLSGESENLTAAKTAISEAGVRLTVLKGGA